LKIYDPVYKTGGFRSAQISSTLNYCTVSFLEGTQEQNGDRGTPHYRTVIPQAQLCTLSRVVPRLEWGKLSISSTRSLLLPLQIQMFTDLHTCTPKYNYASFRYIKCPPGNYTGESSYVPELHQTNTIPHFQAYICLTTKLIQTLKKAPRSTATCPTISTTLISSPTSSSSSVRNPYNIDQLHIITKLNPADTKYRGVKEGISLPN